MTCIPQFRTFRPLCQEKSLSALTVFVLIARLAAADGPPTSVPRQKTRPSSCSATAKSSKAISSRNGDYYAVTGPDQEMQIRVSSVEFICCDLRDGYERKKAAIHRDDIQQHLQLLLWCERHGLLDCARQELDAVEAIDPDHPMIAVLRRRLKIESQPVAGQARPAEKVERPPSDEILDHMTRGMPPGTVELFVQVVQPILLNHYPGARGYSLPDNKRLQLMRPPLHEMPGRRITQRNLYAVLQCIDWANPGESPMLKAASGSAFRHGGKRISRQVLNAVSEARPMGLSGDAKANAARRRRGRERLVCRLGRRRAFEASHTTRRRTFLIFLLLR